MSNSVRLDIRDAVIAVLNADLPTDMVEATKRRWVPSEENRGPLLGVFFLDEPAARVGGRAGPLTQRSLNIGVQVVVSATAPDLVDDLAEVVLQHVVERMGNTTLGGLATNVTEAATIWEPVKMDRIYLSATVRFVVEFQTVRNDLSKRQ